MSELIQWDRSVLSLLPSMWQESFLPLSVLALSFLCGAGDFNLWSILCRRDGLPLFLRGAYSFGGAIFFSFGRVFLRGGLSVLPDAMRSLHCNGETPFNAVFSKIRKMDRVRVLRASVFIFFILIIAQASLRIE